MHILSLVTDYFSAISSDDDEEFFELPSENSDIIADAPGKTNMLLSRNGHASKPKPGGNYHYLYAVSLGSLI